MALAQAVPGGPGPVEPPTTTTRPPRDFGPDAPPNVYFIPEVVGNITFGGPKRNRLFMAGSQSLYAVFVGTQGAARA